MATKHYGQTWWGEQWLQALTAIDCENRLPRGRTYANKGAVKHLLIQGGTVSAKVQGSRPQPYNITLKVPAVSARDQQQLLEHIIADPIMLARLLNGELDSQLLTLARKLDIDLFPHDWEDLAMRCSCPDWAVPCKHIAATIYLLSQEVDGNPFLIFSLRGVDLIAALAERGLHVGQDSASALPSLAELLPEVSDDKTRENVLLTNESVDFSRIPELSDALLALLPVQPAFFNAADFRLILQRVLKRVAKTANKTLTQLNEASDCPFLTTDKPCLHINEQYEVQVTGVAGITDISALLVRVGQLSPEQLLDLPPAFSFLYQLRLFVLHLLARGAVVPHIFSLEKTTVGLRWLPALLDNVVGGLMQQLRLPPNTHIVTRQHGKKQLTLAANTQVEALCSVMLDDYVHKWSEGLYEKPYGDPSLELFFVTGKINYRKAGEGSIAQGIHHWLARFQSLNSVYTPVICLDDHHHNVFDLTLAIDDSSTVLTTPTPLASVLSDASWSSARLGIMRTLSLLTPYFPPLNAYIRTGARLPLALSTEQLPEFLFKTLPVLRLLGIRTLLPKTLEQLLRPRLSVKIASKPRTTSGFLQLSDVLSFDWQIAIGDHLLSYDEFMQLVNSASGVIQFKSDYVYLKPEEIAQLQAQLAKPPKLSQSELLQTALAGEYEGAGICLDQATQQLLQELLQTAEVALPQGLIAHLRPYQERGFAWLYRNAVLGMGSIIADDMGLGKTLQVISLLQKLKEENQLQQDKVLVIVPTSLLSNWQKELQRFAPQLTVDIFHGGQRQLATERADVLLTTYGVIRSDVLALKTLSWRLVITDEAQNIKNPQTAQTKAVKAIPARSFIAMSGTPVENGLSEYWSIMDFANRGYLGKLTPFVKNYITPIQTHHDQQVIQRFKRITAPFVLRRLKSDKSIISDLPDKIQQNQYCTLGKEQTALYESVVQHGLSSIAGEANTFQRQGLVLQMIMALKQVCNHPAQYLKQGTADPLLSGKVERLFDLLDAIHAQQEKVLIFTQFKEMGMLLSQWIQARYRHPPLFLHGGLSRAKRDELVERFQHEPIDRVFILSLKAGGTGLNLTAASQVIHYDLWWNPAVEAQATDRAYRIGQQRNVQVHRFICRSTFEERINDMIDSKRELADLTVGRGEQWIGQLNNQELAALFKR